MSITKSYTFTNNTIIDPTEVNQNFDDLVASIKAAHHSDADGTKILPADVNASWGLVPVGGIILWSGTIATIPTGYLFCNGADGTIDLRNRFALCPGQDDGGTYDTGDTGGAETINISHSHTVNSHAHTYSGSTGNCSDSEDGGEGSGSVANNSHDHNYSGTTSSVAPGTNAQLSASQSVMNPFRATVYIQKV